MGSFKSSVSRRANCELNLTSIWQRNYYEHIIRSEEEHRRIYDYIETNPVHWDEENPSAST